MQNLTRSRRYCFVLTYISLTFRRPGSALSFSEPNEGDVPSRSLPTVPTCPETSRTLPGNSTLCRECWEQPPDETNMAMATTTEVLYFQAVSSVVWLPAWYHESEISRGYICQGRPSCNAYGLFEEGEVKTQFTYRIPVSKRLHAYDVKESYTHSRRTVERVVGDETLYSESSGSPRVFPSSRASLVTPETRDSQD
ncbi:hypothetical protein EDD17DRAFT_1168649 [Pisolithus thermaeus]|nr:hypothetical protein EV401DRAFT_702904 [Pisolithus croceorrhizus]KAI6166523.1 hypothetical protein EDD17DRAFT_1168649 [Pisolithus thermaeus]